MEERGDQAVFVDDEVGPQVLSVIRNAAKYAVVVTPYLKLWGHAKQAVEQAVQRGAEVTFILRAETENINKAAEDITWLLKQKAKVLVVPNLHAKIYLNETTTLVSSMNILSSSNQGSREFAMMVKDPGDAKQIRGYVLERLKGAVEPLDAWIRRVSESPTPTAVTERQSGYGTDGRGLCIRCGQPRPLDPSKPLCDACYITWAEYENEDYPEKFCHVCGRPSDVSYARPLCQRCYRSFAR